MTWLYGSAKCVGIAHKDSETPCQDSYDIERSEDGKWVAVAVCDGAGSAKHSEVGSNLVAKTFAKKLIHLSKEIETRQPGAWINDFVIQQILNVRDELRLKAGSDDLSNFHTTLVAFLINDLGGFAIHIGDGVILGGITMDSEDQNGLDKEIFVSKPENGEYSNETYFITEGDWIKHLRITPMPSLDWVFIGSDGGSAFFADVSNNPKQDFIRTFINDLKSRDSTEWNSRISEVLSDTQANKITNDDKTLIFFTKEDFIKNLKQINFLSIKKTETIPHYSYSTTSPNIQDKENKSSLTEKKSRKKLFIRVFLIMFFFVSLLTYFYIFLLTRGFFHPVKHLIKLI